jgi:hypothetical protein
MIRNRLTLAFGLAMAVSIGLCTISSRADEVTGPMPEVCIPPNDDAVLARKLAGIAFKDAERKSVSLRDYNRVFAVPYHSRLEPDRKIWGVRFSPFRCNEMVTDGGGYDVEIDPTTFEVIDSFFSAL